MLSQKYGKCLGVLRYISDREVRNPPWAYNTQSNAPVLHKALDECPKYVSALFFHTLLIYSILTYINIHVYLLYNFEVQITVFILVKSTATVVLAFSHLVLYLNEPKASFWSLYFCSSVSHLFVTCFMQPSSFLDACSFSVYRYTLIIVMCTDFPPSS